MVVGIFPCWCLSRLLPYSLFLAEFLTTYWNLSTIVSACKIPCQTTQRRNSCLLHVFAPIEALHNAMFLTLLMGMLNMHRGHIGVQITDVHGPSCFKQTYLAL